MRDPTDRNGEPPPGSPDEPPANRDWPEPTDSDDRPPASGGLAGYAADSGLIYRRVGAYVIDSLLIALAALVLGTATGVINMDIDAPSVEPSLWLWTLAFEVLYRWSMQSAFGATLGKLALGLRLVAADGNMAGPIQVMVREVGLGTLLGLAQYAAQLTGFAILPSLVQVMLVYVVLHRPDQRSLHDLTVQTRVIRVPSEDSDTPMRPA